MPGLFIPWDPTGFPASCNPQMSHPAPPWVLDAQRAPKGRPDLQPRPDLSLGPAGPPAREMQPEVLSWEKMGVPQGKSCEGARGSFDISIKCQNVFPLEEILRSLPVPISKRTKRRAVTGGGAPQGQTDAVNADPAELPSQGTKDQSVTLGRLQPPWGAVMETAGGVLGCSLGAPPWILWHCRSLGSLWLPLSLLPAGSCP